MFSQKGSKTMRNSWGSTSVAVALSAATVGWLTGGEWGVTPARAADAGAYTAMCPKGQGPEKLVFSLWGGMKKDIGPAVQAFTDLTGVPVEYLENGTGDRITKLNAEKGSPTMDIAFVPVNEVPSLLKNGVVMPADPKVPNYDQLAPAAKVAGGYGTSLF